MAEIIAHSRGWGQGQHATGTEPIEQVGLEGAAGEIARIIQEATSLTPSKLMALRNALAENPAGQAALTAWDTIAVHEQMEQDTAQTPNKLRKNRL